MKTHFLTLLFLICAAGSPLLAANTCDLPTYAEAREQAKQTGKALIILRHGSQWLHDDARICSKWDKITKEDSLKGALFCQFDDVLGQKERNKALPLECWNVPEVLVLAPDGTFMARLSTKIVRGKQETIIKRLEKALSIQPEFSKGLDEARALKGKEAAKKAGETLQLLHPDDALRCRALKDIIQNNDPQDETGYRSQFCLDHMGMYREINNRLKGGPDGSLKNADRDFDSALKYVKKVLKNKRLKGERRQQWLCGLAYVHRERIRATKDDNWKPCLDALQEAVDIDPKSETGIGAAKYHRYLDPDSYYEFDDGFYEGGDQTLGFEKEWRVDVSKQMDGEGSYTFSLVPYHNGRLFTRNFRLFINGKQVDAIDDPNKDTKSVNFNVSSLPRNAKVQVRLIARCQDGWFGCSGEFRMEKQ